MAQDLNQQINEIYPTLPKILEGTTFELSLYQGFWCPTGMSPIRGVISFQKCFEAQDTDILVASNPKTGTTWLKALSFSIVNRTRYTPSNTPLLTSNPHDLVPFLDFHLFTQNELPDLSMIPSPRLFAMHTPYAALPDSIKDSNCRIIYVCRNPFDTVVSLCHFSNAFTHKHDAQLSMEEFFELFFKGISPFGPYWDHVLGYWKASLERPDKVLFIKYEDMKEDIVPCLKRIAAFIGYPFSEEEEKNGGIEEIAKLCSLGTLKDLEVNKSGTYLSKHPNKAFFRNGEVGNGVSVLSPAMKLKLQIVMEEKLQGSGLSFKLS
ncbi:cytosolic sulfotransferase 15-like [Euphorbia lathyris]|uniref:cytosolic sulfotransferase 15-like n=1 Tax=Euphorbia lathyris TaxID=212925 RepID=UPI0033133780